ncbi:hypothetical protein [Paenibacillus sp. GCM10023250]|uniref:hypothetical protein n=1 Tax=Paenibacillus sp. GCM10023250 TaxID=3252648 RepID=UPI00361EBD63
MRKAYSRLAFGLTLELIDVRVTAFDLFSDLLGCLLVMWGAYRLGLERRVFMLAWAAAAVLLLPAFAELAGHRVTIPLLGGGGLAQARRRNRHPARRRIGPDEERNL